jgi:hypothetical protein
VRKTVPYLAAWFLVGAVAVGVATAGVSLVGDQVTDSRRAPFSAEQVREELAADTEAQATTTTTAPTVSTTTTTAPAVPPVTGGGSGTAGPSTAGATTTTMTAPPPPAPSTVTYNLVGGTATLRFSASGVTVVAAVPSPGYSVTVSQTHGTGKRVEFESDDHRSRVDGWWDGGPQDEVREDD